MHEFLALALFMAALAIAPGLPPKTASAAPLAGTILPGPRLAF